MGTTIPAFAMQDQDTWGAWLYNAKLLQDDHPDIEFFAALEIDGRGAKVFRPLIEQAEKLGIPFSYFTFLLDDGAREINTGNRLRRITTGQNLVSDYCRSNPATKWLLFLAADLCPEPKAISKLLEIDHPIVGGEVSTYCLDGPKVESFTEFPVHNQMATAAFVMLHRDVFNKISWRWDLDNGDSDDPCLWKDAQNLLGFPTYVRKDCIGTHYPVSISAIEVRVPGRDMSWHVPEGAG